MYDESAKPEACVCGRPLAYPNVLVDWTRCDCDAADGGGHYSWRCLTCLRVAGHEPADYRPPPP